MTFWFDIRRSAFCPLHFICKQPEKDSPEEQQRPVDKIRSRNVYYSTATKREIKKKLKSLGVIKPRVLDKRYLWRCVSPESLQPEGNTVDLRCIYQLETIDQLIYGKTMVPFLSTKTSVGGGGGGKGGPY